MSSLATFRSTFLRPRRLPTSIRQLSTSAPRVASPAAGTASSFPPPPRGANAILPALLAAALGASATYLLAPCSKQEPLSYREPSQATFDAAVRELKEFMPEEFVSQDRDVLLNYGHSDWTAHDPTALAGAVIYPRNKEDVIKIVKLASKYNCPLIPQCAGTSLEGHTSPLGYKNNPNDTVANQKRAAGESVTMDDLKPGLAWVLDFAENMNEIIKINEHDLDVVVQPGVSYDGLNAVLAEKGIPLYFPVDPAPGAQIGGMIGTGASGTNAVKAGTMRENVINLTVVLADGTLLKTRQRAKKSSAGPDLGKLFIGSEGTLGIVVEATLKLSPKLPSTVAVSSFPSIEAAAGAARDLVTGGISLACIELLDEVMIKMINKKGGGITWPEKPSLFLKFSGTQGQIDSDVQRTRSITEQNSGEGFTFAKDDEEAALIWQSRKNVLFAALDYVPGSKAFVTDVCVPMSNFPTLVAETRADVDSHGILAPIFGHAGDGNFHALLLFSTPEEQKKIDGLVHRMVERAQRLDGTCTGEHGAYIENELGPGTVELLRRIKETLDPQNIMNPGKLIPPRDGSIPKY
ncbi:FAD-linked oxidase-like protein [Leucosporidium creatinivorum]|uniref:D-lactate dehydrogenase (cytochrome) n=1 Tax=Leucosporidium creatinivorum TaxID=106004 RepID=A0A1Y2EWN2_9BASI|nr:FAD-linked oxidase-like protein [Leucosporidium creatinivorum]